LETFVLNNSERMISAKETGGAEHR
jgi:hypothetical protein